MVPPPPKVNRPSHLPPPPVPYPQADGSVMPPSSMAKEGPTEASINKNQSQKVSTTVSAGESLISKEESNEAQHKAPKVEKVSLSFDLILPPDQQSVPISLDSELLAQFIEEASKSYGFILVNGFTSDLFIENAVLLEHFETSFLVFGMKELRKKELNFMLKRVDKEKRSGAIVFA